MNCNATVGLDLPASALMAITSPCLTSKTCGSWHKKGFCKERREDLGIVIVRSKRPTRRKNKYRLLAYHTRLRAHEVSRRKGHTLYSRGVDTNISPLYHGVVTIIPCPSRPHTTTESCRRTSEAAEWENYQYCTKYTTIVDKTCECLAYHERKSGPPFTPTDVYLNIERRLIVCGRLTKVTIVSQLTMAFLHYKF